MSVHDLLSFSEEYNLMVSTFTQILPLLKDLFMMILLLMLAYSLVGTIQFGGLVDQTSKEKFRTRIGEKLEDNYEYLNFNDILNGMIFLFAILS